jgi:hypothetical protein
LESEHSVVSFSQKPLKTVQLPETSCGPNLLQSTVSIQPIQNFFGLDVVKVELALKSRQVSIGQASDCIGQNPQAVTSLKEPRSIETANLPRSISNWQEKQILIEVPTKVEFKFKQRNKSLQPKSQLASIPV